MRFADYIKAELLILVPVLFFIGKALKHSRIPERLDPFLRGICGIVLAGIYLFSTDTYNDADSILSAIFAALTQGILAAGASVYVRYVCAETQKRK